MKDFGLPLGSDRRTPSEMPEAELVERTNETLRVLTLKVEKVSTGAVELTRQIERDLSRTARTIRLMRARRRPVQVVRSRPSRSPVVRSRATTRRQGRGRARAPGRPSGSDEPEPPAAGVAASLVALAGAA